VSEPHSPDDDVERRFRALKGEVVDGPLPTGSRPVGGNPSRPGGSHPRGAAVRVVGWSFGQAEAGRLGLWIGLGFVAIGSYLMLAQFVPGVRAVGALALGLAGGVLLARVATGRSGAWALNLGAILAGYGGLGFLADVARLGTAGWGTLGAGLGLLAVAGLRARRGEGLGWQTWIGGFFVVWGGWGTLRGAVPGFPSLGDLLLPGFVVLLGIAFLRRGISPGR
jgi:hypothetical protein